MAAPKLTEEQREALLMWMAAEYDTRLIRRRFAANGWPDLSRAALAYYRKRYGSDIEALRKERRDSALNSGLALKEERVARLAIHADELDAIKWVAGENGRYWNEKAWRETLDDIAREMGHRRQGIDVALQQEIEAILDRLRNNLSREEYAKVLALLGGGSATPRS